MARSYGVARVRCSSGSDTREDEAEEPSPLLPLGDSEAGVRAADLRGLVSGGVFGGFMGGCEYAT